MNKTPAVRFKGSTEEWEHRKLGELVHLNGRIGFRGYTQNDIISKDEGGILTFSPTNIINNQLILDIKNTYITQEKYDESPEIKIRNDDILFVKTGSTLGKSALVTGLTEPASINPQIVVMRTKTELRRYLSAQLTSVFIQKQVTVEKIGGAVPTLTETKIKNFDVFIPVDSKESTSIGDCFSNIDSLITFHQRKYEKLKNIKKSMLYKMFPRNGSKVPEIRFAGFTGDWEQRKLGDEAIEMVAGGDIDKSLLDDYGKYPVIANALTDDGIVGYYASDYRIKAPAVTVTGRGDVGHAKARTVDFTPVVRLLSVRSKHDVFFLENAINTLNVIVESTGVPQLTVPQLSQYEIFFPPTITEEKEIGAFFERVDNLITLHQRKLEKLKQLKQAMLHKMFV